MLMNWHSHEEGPGDHRRGDRDSGEERGEGRGHGRRGPRGGGRGFDRPGGWQNVDLPPADDAQAWFEGRLPGDWFTDVTVTVDREEITVVGKLADEELSDSGAEPRGGRRRKSARIRASSSWRSNGLTR